MKKFISLFGEENEQFQQLNEHAEQYAKEHGFEYEWQPQIPFEQEKVIELLRTADVGLIDVQKYDHEIFDKINERCKLLIRFGVGFDAVNLEEASRAGICVCRTSGTNAQSVAEMALSLLLAALRQHAKNRKVIESGKWVKNVSFELSGKTVGILGYGAIGQRFAELLKGFGCRILAYDPFINREKAEQDCVTSADLDQVFRESDAISVHMPYNAETHHLINADRFAQMKSNAVIVCTARGNIIDETALYDALKNGWIFAAGLDVFAKEPLAADDPLLSLDNIILTPHVSAQTYDSLEVTYEKAIDIAADFFAGKDLSRSDLLNPDYKR